MWFSGNDTYLYGIYNENKLPTHTLQATCGTLLTSVYELWSSFSFLSQRKSTPTAPWAFAHRPVGVGFLLYKNANEGKTFLSLASCSPVLGAFQWERTPYSHLTRKVPYFHDFWFYVAWIVPKIVPNPLTFANSTKREYTLCLYKCKKNLSLYPTIQLFFRNLP